MPLGNMLSEVANDSTLNQKTEPVKAEKEKPVVVADTSSAVKQDNQIDEPKNNDAENKTNAVVPAALTAAAVATVTEKAALIKITESSTNEGKDMVFCR
jgi:hypothetical protein